MKKVLLLCGGNSPEHNVSLISAQSILKNIDKNLFEVTTCIIDFDNLWYEFLGEPDLITEWYKSNSRAVTNIVDYLKSFDVVFPITHGTNGEDGKLQGLLDLFNIKYVGCKTLSSSLGMDKHFSKIIFEHLNIPQVPFVVIKDPKTKLDNIINKLDFPMIVKPANGGSSVGIEKANNKRELKRAIHHAFKYDQKIIVEKYIVARELECAILDADNFSVSEIGEIKSANEFYDYDAKYKNAASYTLVPAELDTEVSNTIKEYAKLAFCGMEAKGLSRIDFFYDEANKKIYLNEVNTLPGFTEISMYPKLIMHCGISYTDLITKLINNC